MSQLERKQLAEKKALQKDALSDWELRYAQAKLELKEKHYKVIWAFSLSKNELWNFDQRQCPSSMIALFQVCL